VIFKTDLSGFRWCFPALLLLVVFAAIPLFSASAEFTGDDYYYVANNPLVTSSGITSLPDIWKRPMKNEYFPVTITSYAFEYMLWGDNVRFYHLTNLMIFACIGFAARSLAIRLAEGCSTGIDRKRISLLAGIATILMLCHPLNVESMASISNRKELLYVLFSLLSFRMYISTSRNAGTVFAAVIFMVFAQLSKGAAVIVPTLFIACEFLPSRKSGGLTRFVVPIFSFLLAFLIFIIQFRVAFKAGVIEKNANTDFLSRMGGVVSSLNMMIEKFLFPVNLAYDYDLAWPNGFPALTEWLLPLAVFGGILLLLLKRKYDAFLVSIMMLLTLLPYLNIIPLHHNDSGQMVFYDHYLLFATMLSAALLTIIIRGFEERLQAVAVTSAIIISLVLSGYNYYLCRFWSDREALYSRIIQVAPGLPKGYLFLGKVLNEKGRHQEAIAVLEKMFTLKNWFPTYLEAYREIGNAYAFSGHMKEAESAYRIHLNYLPKDRGSLQNLSSALMEQKKYEEGKSVILTWLSYYPGDNDARHNLILCEQMIRLNK
jgi:tetratricopeptide (TPR) repeat protein